MFHSSASLTVKRKFNLVHKGFLAALRIYFMLWLNFSITPLSSLTLTNVRFPFKRSELSVKYPPTLACCSKLIDWSLYWNKVSQFGQRKLLRFSNFSISWNFEQPPSVLNTKYCFVCLNSESIFLMYIYRTRTISFEIVWFCFRPKIGSTHLLAALIFSSSSLMSSL